MHITAKMTGLAILGLLAVAPIGMGQAHATSLPDRASTGATLVWRLIYPVPGSPDGPSDLCERVRRGEVVTILPVDCGSHAPSDLCEKIRRGELNVFAPVNCGSHGMVIQTGSFCHTPIGRFGPGPVNPVGTQCFVDTPAGRVWGGVGN